MITKLSLRFTHTKKISWEDKSQYYKISGAQSSRHKIVWQLVDFRHLPASNDNPDRFLPIFFSVIEDFVLIEFIE